MNIILTFNLEDFQFDLKLPVFYRVAPGITPKRLGLIRTISFCKEMYNNIFEGTITPKACINPKRLLFQSSVLLQNKSWLGVL